MKFRFRVAVANERKTEPAVNDLLAALGLAVAIEGVIYALFPDAMKNFMAQVLDQPTSNLRRAGLIAATVGVFVVWVARG